MKKRYDENDYDVAVCGDTNMFELNRGNRPTHLRWLETFERFGVHPSQDSNARPKHISLHVRMNPSLRIRLPWRSDVWVDFPECFDVIVSSSKL